jgi:iron-sulfur cluster assembly protein
MEEVQLTKFESDFPLDLTQLALEAALQAKLSDPTLTDKAFLRVSVKGGGCSGFLQELAFDDKLDEDDDVIREFSVNDKTLSVVVDSFSAMYLKGTTIDYVKTDFSEGFKFIGGESVKNTCGCGKSFSV